MTRHDAVTEIALLVEPEIAGPMGDKRVELAERRLVEEQLEPFPRGQLAALVLLLDSRRSPALGRLSTKRDESLQLLGGRHGCSLQRGMVGPAGIEPATSRL